MTWTIDAKKREATDEYGYRITWATNKHGTYFNAYSPFGKHIDAGYDKEIVKVMCDQHRRKLEHDRAMHAAYKGAKERKAMSECQNSYCVLLGDHAECMTEDAVMTKVNPTFGGPEQ